MAQARTGRVINAIRNTPEHTGVRTIVQYCLGRNGYRPQLALGDRAQRAAAKRLRASAEGCGLGVRRQYANKHANKGRATDWARHPVPQGYSYRRGIRLSGLY